MHRLLTVRAVRTRPQTPASLPDSAAARVVIQASRLVAPHDELAGLRHFGYIAFELYSAAHVVELVFHLNASFVRYFQLRHCVEHKTKTHFNDAQLRLVGTNANKIWLCRCRLRMTNSRCRRL